jgi:hypothetical protein
VKGGERDDSRRTPYEKLGLAPPPVCRDADRDTEGHTEGEPLCDVVRSRADRDADARSQRDEEP